MIMAWPLAVIVVAPIAGRLTERLAPGAMGGVGLAILAFGLISLGFIPLGVPKLATGVALALCGAGFAVFQTPNNRMMLSLAPIERSGAAGGNAGHRADGQIDHRRGAGRPVVPGFVDDHQGDVLRGLCAGCGGGPDQPWPGRRKLAGGLIFGRGAADTKVTWA
jgi:hypothetical protein